MSKKMASRQGMVTNTPQSSREQLRGLADNTALADQIVCVAMKYLENDCPPSAIENGHSQNDSFCAVQLLQTYTSTKWYKRDRTLKTSGDNLYNYYPNQNEPAPNFCAIFVWTVWYEAAWCLGGVDGLHDSYLFKSSRAYGGSDQLSMHGGTAIGGKTSIDKAPAKGSAFVRRRDDGGGGGHAGIVSAVTSSGFTTIEGNGVQADKTGQPFETRIYTNTDIAKYDMWFLHVENTPVINADYPREDGRCCTPKTPNDSINPCDNSQKPSGTGWERTSEAIYNSILAVQGAQQAQIIKYYTDQGLEFSSEFCFNRVTQTTNLSPSCDGFKCPPGYESAGAFSALNYAVIVQQQGGMVYEYERDSNNVVTGKIINKRPATQTDICCKPVSLPPPPTSTKCPDVTLSKTSCTTALRVSSTKFDATSVPHYSVLYRNRLMAADITGSKWTFQTVGSRDTSMIGSALALPKPEKIILDINGDVIENLGIQFSGFGTFSDGNGNLIVIVPEWQTSRLNSLIGAKDNDGKQVKSLLGGQGFYQVNVHAYTGNGAYHAQAADANYICGSDVVIDGMNPAVLTTNSNSLHWYSEWDSKKFANVQKERFVDENLFAGGKKLPIESLIFDYIVTSKDASRPGLLNIIESNGRKYDKPILVVLKSSPPPFNWMDFVETVITIAASFAPMVGIPPQIFTMALSAIKTIESIAQGNGNVLGSVVQLAGLVSALLPAELRGQINEMIGDSAKDILGTEATEFLQSQEKIVGKYLVDAKNFLQDVQKAPIQAFQTLGFDKSASEILQQKIFGSLNTDLQNFKPSWFDFASDYSKNLKGDFDKGFNQGVKLLHSIESIQTTQNFSRYANSGLLENDITKAGSALNLTEFQNLMIGGLAGGVMSANPNITKVLSAIMNQTNDILQGGYDSSDTNIGEIASVLKVANGFMGDPKDFDRMTLQSLSLKINNLTSKDKITKFVLPPSLTKEQQECWGKELNQCFGIEIVTQNGTIKKDTVTKDNTPPVKYPPCIKIVNGSFKYCPPSTCKTGLSDDYNPSANYQLNCPELTAENIRGMVEIATTAKQTIDSKGNTIFISNGVLYQERPAIQGNAIGTYKIPNTQGEYGYRLFYGLCEMVELPALQTTSRTPIKQVTETTTPTQAQTEQPCAVMYDARVSPGVPDRWYAQIAGQWVEIIDCCPDVKTQTSDCCSETQKSLAQMKLDLAKVVELVGRNQAGEKCPECDLSEIKKLIAEIPKTTQFQYDDELIRKEIRAGFAELRAMIGQIKQYDVSKDLLEIKDLIKAIKIQDCSVISQEIKDLKNFILTQTTVPTVKTTGQTEQPNTDAKYEELKNLILSKNTVYQKDYSSELAQITKELEFLRYQFPITTTTITKEIQTTTDATQKIDLEKLLKEQTDLFTQKINNLEQKLNKPCEECTEIAKLSKSLEEVRQLILSQKPSTNTTTIKEVSNTNDKAEITRLRNELEKWQLKFEQMDEAFRTEIDRSNGATKEDLQLQHNEQIEIYTDLLTKYVAELKTKSAQTETPKITTATPPKISEKPVYKNGECTNCPKVVESHTRTIYEYPPQQTVIQEPCNDCN